MRLLPYLIALVAVSACKKGEDGPLVVPDETSPLTAIDETARYALPGLTGEGFVMRSAANIPYIYARNREDLGRIQGFVVARDRFFQMDMIRRLAQGRVSELLGDAALEVDQESRGVGMTIVTRAIVDAMDANPELGSLADGYVDGINAYIDAVAAGSLPAPSELELIAPVLGGVPAIEMMAYWERRDVAAVGATLVYELGFETGDQRRHGHYEALAGMYAGAALEDLRRAGITADVWDRVEPVFPIASAPGWGISAGSRRASGAGPLPAADTHVPGRLLERLGARMERLERRFGHDHEGGWGSNAWAVAGSASADGRALLAGDGHLPLTVPSLFYAAGLDTEHLGGGDIHQVGLLIPGEPVLAVGTNRDVAWSQTQLMGDITDWYREELQLDENGSPSASLFQGAWQPLVRVEEAYEIADVPLLDSVGRTEVWARWQTFDGRVIAEIEGRDAAVGETVEPGETLVNVQGIWIVPGDLDGDGVVTAISFDYAGFEAGGLFALSDSLGRSTSVEAFHAEMTRAVAYSQNLVAADSSGSILYTGYQAVPCRGYLPRNPDGSWIEGADPTRLLDGTTYGGFEIPLENGRVVEGSSDPYRCLVPFADYPASIDPPEGYVLNANNDPGNISTDGSLADDPWYIGGPWVEGYRAQRIDELLAEVVADGTADEDAMARIQADHHSNVGRQLLPVLLEAVDLARALADDGGELTAAEARLVGLYEAHADRFDEAVGRLVAWQAAGHPARSGVETFYSQPEGDDRAYAVATSLFNAWVGRFVRSTFDDEGWVGVFQPTGDTGRTRTLTRMLAGRGPDNPEDMASWNPATGESAFFDVLGTDEIEISHELALLAFAEGLATLEAEFGALYFEDDGVREQMDDWLWGLLHTVHFDSLMEEVISADDEDFGFLVQIFSIDTNVLPLLDSFPVGDPRRQLDQFPRHGDHLNVDAGNSGFGGTGFDYGSGPVFRMVIALGGDGPSGRNILPGGQSGLTDSTYFADQAELWLGNRALPMHLTISEVIRGATGRETYVPR